MSTVRILWLVDENENQSRTYARMLRRGLPDSITVQRQFPPFPMVEEYAELLDAPETVCFVIDQRLKDTGIATYTGIELAQYLRGINSKIPIYILTNFPDSEDEYASGEWSVEDIVNKRSMTSPDKLQTLVARLTRRINIYSDILEARTERFNELLRKKVTDKLSSEEANEFAELQFARLAPSEATDKATSSGLDELIILNQQKILDMMKEQLRTDDD